MRWLPLVLAANTAAADSTIDPKPIDPTAKLTGDTVLVWNDATFYLEADANGPKLVLGVLDKPRKDQVGYTLPLHVLGTSGDFVEVEPIAGTDCGWTTLSVPPDLTKLRVFVKRTDLAPVVTKPFVKAYKDGTTLDIKPGLAVVPLATGAYRVSFETFEIDAPIPATSVGYAYSGFNTKRTTTKSGDFYVDDKTTVTLGDRTFELPRMIKVATVDKRKTTTFLPVTVTCAKARLSVANADVQSGEFGQGFGIGGGGSGRGQYGERWVLPKGTAVFAPGLKRQVAVTAREVEVTKPDGKHEACFVRDWELAQPYPTEAPWTKTPQPRPKLMVCAPASSVLHVNDAPARP